MRDQGWTIFSTPSAQGGYFAQAVAPHGGFGEATGRSEPDAVELAKGIARKAAPVAGGVVGDTERDKP